MCSAKGHVRFTPESGHVRRTTSCLLSADRKLSGLRSVRGTFGPRQELCRIPHIVAFMPFSSLGFITDYYHASGKIFWLPLLTPKRLRKVLQLYPYNGHISVESER